MGDVCCIELCGVKQFISYLFPSQGSILLMNARSVDRRWTWTQFSSPSTSSPTMRRLIITRPVGLGKVRIKATLSTIRGKSIQSQARVVSICPSCVQRFQTRPFSSSTQPFAKIQKVTSNSPWAKSPIIEGSELLQWEQKWSPFGFRGLIAVLAEQRKGLVLYRKPRGSPWLTYVKNKPITGTS